MTPLLQLRAVLDAAPDTVADLLLDVRPGGRSPLAPSGTVEPAGGDAFTVTLDGSRMTVAVDRAARSVTLQGEWWYRGVTSVQPDPRGTLLVQQIFNVAPGNRWAVRFVSRGPLNRAPSTFAGHVAAIAAQLHCAAWVVD